MYCPRCGNRLEENARFCGRCGAMLAAGPAADSRKPRKKRGRGCLTAALLLLLFLTLGGGGFAAYHFGVLDGRFGPERQEEPDGEEIRKEDPESEKDSPEEENPEKEIMNPEEEKENPEKGMEKNGETEAEASETWEELPDLLQETEEPYTVIRPAGAR